MSEYKMTRILADDVTPLDELAASPAELGDDAGAYTWQNCLEEAEIWGDSLQLDLEDVRAHFAEYGAWSREEINAWSPRELQALVIQETAACLREEENGGDPGHVYREGDEIYIYLGV